MRTQYSRNSGYTVSRRSTRRSMIRPTARRISFGPTTAKIIGISVLAILGFVMLSRSTGNSTDAYKQLELRKEVGAAQRDLEALKIEAQRAQSLSEVQQSEVKDSMVPVKGVVPVEKGEVAGAATAAPTAVSR